MATAIRVTLAGFRASTLACIGRAIGSEARFVSADTCPAPRSATIGRSTGGLFGGSHSFEAAYLTSRFRNRIRLVVITILHAEAGRSKLGVDYPNASDNIRSANCPVVSAGLVDRSVRSKSRDLHGVHLTSPLTSWVQRSKYGESLVTRNGN
jgi:hypothetical protein